jgi:hypothetical protein
MSTVRRPAMTRRVLFVLAAMLVVPGTVLCETTRAVHAALSVSAGASFAVENLAGKMTVRPGEGNDVTAVATIHAETAELANAVTFEQVRGEHGTPTLRVRYNLGLVHTVRVPGARRSAAEYDGRRVRVSGTSGTLIYADVEVRVPRRDIGGRFRNLFGSLDAEGIAGRIVLDTDGADVLARALEGDIRADVGSGDVRAEGIKGKFTCDSGSGACEVTGFDGEELLLDTGSGAVRVRAANARRISADTGSGGVRIEDADAEDVRADSGSGSVEMGLIGSRLRRVKADTGSGEVTLRLPSDASFELLADQGSGDLTCGYPDAAPIAKKRMIIGYRRGDGRIRIDVDTGSGDVTVTPSP